MLLTSYRVNGDEYDLNFAKYLYAQAKKKFYKDGIWYLSNTLFKSRAYSNNKYYTSALSKMLENMLQLDKETFKKTLQKMDSKDYEGVWIIKKYKIALKGEI